MGTDLLTIFKEEISEQTRKQARSYSLPVMMYLSVIAILMGAKNPIEIYQWMQVNTKSKEIKKLLGVEFYIYFTRMVILWIYLGLSD